GTGVDADRFIAGTVKFSDCPIRAQAPARCGISKIAAQHGVKVSRLVGAYRLVRLRVLSCHGLVPPSSSRAFCVVATLVASFAVATGSPDYTLCAPECPGSQFRPFHQCLELGPDHLRVYLLGLCTGAKAAIDPGDDVLAPQHSGVA